MLCDAATDYKGKLNLPGMINSIFTRELPANYPQCSIALRVVFKWVEEGQLKLRIIFFNEDGKFVMSSIGLPFEKFGRHAVDIAIDGRQGARIPLEVKYNTEQESDDDAGNDNES